MQQPDTEFSHDVDRRGSTSSGWPRPGRHISLPGIAGLLLGALALSPAADATAVGRMAAEFGVDPAGAATRVLSAWPPPRGLPQAPPSLAATMAMGSLRRLTIAGLSAFPRVPHDRRWTA